jgi:hypothetical protein
MEVKEDLLIRIREGLNEWPSFFRGGKGQQLGVKERVLRYPALDEGSKPLPYL